MRADRVYYAICNIMRADVCLSYRIVNKRADMCLLCKIYIMRADRVYYVTCYIMLADVCLSYKIVNKQADMCLLCTMLYYAGRYVSVMQDVILRRQIWVYCARNYIIGQISVVFARCYTMRADICLLCKRVHYAGSMCQVYNM